VTALRRNLTGHRWLAAAIIAVALLMRVLVPAGYMAARTASGITIELCSGVSASAPTGTAMSAMHHGGEKPGHHAQPELPCAFAAVAVPSLAAADPLIFAIAIGFIFAVMLPPRLRLSVTSATFLRPPLRGPPTIA
jgi:hypothetical protein